MTSSTELFPIAKIVIRLAGGATMTFEIPADYRDAALATIEGISSNLAATVRGALADIDSA